jgi:hypothetical protein
MVHLSPACAKHSHVPSHGTAAAGTRHAANVNVRKAEEHGEAAEFDTVLYHTASAQNGTATTNGRRCRHG